VFDIIKIGIGPSSSHTLGPWIAARKVCQTVAKRFGLDSVMAVQVDLFGSLALTGRGHGTDFAVLLGLSGEDYLTLDLKTIPERMAQIEEDRSLRLGGQHKVDFDSESNLRFRHGEFLPYHPNALRFRFDLEGDRRHEENFYSVGGGFVVHEGEEIPHDTHALPFPIQNADELERHCAQQDCRISQIVRQNELTWRSPQALMTDLDQLWQTMQACIYRGCHREGELPGGLGVKRRAPAMNRKLLGEVRPSDLTSWLDALEGVQPNFHQTLKLVSCFAIATNEENASFGRVVTAPTNGAAGVIPAVMMYYAYFCEDARPERLLDFMLVAGEIGSLFKKGATISAAMGGCQAEIGIHRIRRRFDLGTG